MKNDTLELSIILKGNMLRLFYKIMHAKHFILKLSIYCKIKIIQYVS